jgi:hypothetical protein
MMFFSVPVVCNFSRLGEKPSGKPFHHYHHHHQHPRRTPEVNYFSDYGRKESFIDLQLPAVSRQRGQEGKQGKINIIWTG